MRGESVGARIRKVDLSTQHRRGVGAVGAIAVIVVLAVVGFAAWFFLSKPFQTRVREQYNQATEWTPEQIQADPVTYLTWASNEVAKTEAKLKAHELSLQTKMNGAERELNKGSAEKTDLEKLLADCKQAYRDASSAKKWPAEVRGVALDEAALKRKVYECDGKLEGVKSLIEARTKARDLFDRKKNEVGDKLAEISKLKSKLETDLAMAEVKKTVEGIGSLGDQVNSIVDTSQALVSTSEPTLEDMMVPSGQRRVDEEFERIMAK